MNQHRTKQTIQIDLPNGRRDVIGSSIRDIYRVGDSIFGTATIFGAAYPVKLMEQLHQWRIVDFQGKYRRVEFPEGMAKYINSRIMRPRQAEIGGDQCVH